MHWPLKPSVICIRLLACRLNPPSCGDLPSHSPGSPAGYIFRFCRHSRSGLEGGGLVHAGMLARSGLTLSRYAPARPPACRRQGARVGLRYPMPAAGGCARPDNSVPSVPGLARNLPEPTCGAPQSVAFGMSVQPAEASLRGLSRRLPLESSDGPKQSSYSRPLRSVRMAHAEASSPVKQLRPRRAKEIFARPACLNAVAKPADILLAAELNNKFDRLSYIRHGGAYHAR